jgi:uncharacterized protein
MTRNGRGGPFVVAVAALRKHPGTRRRSEVSSPIPELEISNSRVPEGSEVCLDVVVESVSGGVLVTGSVSADWEGDCRRCLEPARGRLTAAVRELFSDDPDPELGYPVTADWLDLEPLAHDACILELPLAPLCGDDCLGLCPGCGANLNREACTCTAKPDPRWAVLSGLVAPEAEPDWRE